MTEPSPRPDDPTDETPALTAQQRDELERLASEVGEVLPDGLDAGGADRLIAELRDRADHGAQTYSSE